MIKKISLRKAVLNDMDLIYRWTNDPEVRANSLNANLISFEEHQEWFQKKLESPLCHIFILNYDSHPAGVIRFEFDEPEQVWTIAYSIEEGFRGQGLGKLILQEGINALGKYPIIGYVKPSNVKSLRVFESLGFKNGGLLSVKGIEVTKFIKSKI